jgi:hypothetical protein
MNIVEEKTNKIAPMILAIIGVLYGVSPIDILPDVIPVVGWIDDLVITGGSILGLMQAFVNDTSKGLAQLIGFVKWVLWILGGVLIILVGLLGVTLYKLFT